MGAVFVVLPFFLLAAYPCRCFHKCLNFCGLRFQIFHVFMDAFLGSYKTEPRDLRYFSALYLLLRMLVLAQPHFFPSQLMLFTSGFLFLVSGVVLALFQPYKVKADNTIDCILLVLAGTYFVSYYASVSLYSEGNSNYIVTTVLQLMSGSFILLFFIAIILHKAFSKQFNVVLQKAKSVWNSVLLKYSRGHTKEDAIETFEREQDSSIEDNSYPPLLEYH